MNRIFKATSKLLFAIVPLALLALTLFLVSCGKTGSSAKPDNVDYYTCTMHPSVRSQDPKAKCPICSMELVPVKKQDAKTGGSDEHTGHDHATMATAKPAGGEMTGMSMPSGGDKMTGNDKPHEFTVPLDRQQLIGVTYAKVEKT